MVHSQFHVGILCLGFASHLGLNGLASSATPTASRRLCVLLVQCNLVHFIKVAGVNDLVVRRHIRHAWRLHRSPPFLLLLLLLCLSARELSDPPYSPPTDQLHQNAPQSSQPETLVLAAMGFNYVGLSRYCTDFIQCGVVGALASRMNPHRGIAMRS